MFLIEIIEIISLVALIIATIALLADIVVEKYKNSIAVLAIVVVFDLLHLGIDTIVLDKSPDAFDGLIIVVMVLLVAQIIWRSIKATKSA